MYKEDLVLNNSQWLIYHKAWSNQTKLGKSGPESNANEETHNILQTTASDEI